jgi:hypothetical protein
MVTRTTRRELTPRDVTKRLRGKDYRHAFEAVAALRGMDREEAMRLIPVIDPPDEQRAFQLLAARLVAEGGVRNLAAHWAGLPMPEWREKLMTEIGPEWLSDEGTVELLIAALGDPEPAVERRAMCVLRDCLQPRSRKERAKAAKTQSGKAAQEAVDQFEKWLSPAHRERIAWLVTAALERAGDKPKALLWPDWYIELLGLTATRGNTRALEALERLRPMAGEPRRTEFEKLDPDNLPWPTSVIAEKKGIPPGTPFMRVKSIATGLLDLKNLERAIAAIKARDDDSA